MRVPVILLAMMASHPSVGAELSLYENPCGVQLQAEIKFVEGGLTAVLDKWRLEVRARFDAKKLNQSQRQSAEQAFASLVEKTSTELGKGLSISGLYRTLTLMPVLAPGTCKDAAQLRSLSEQSIAGYESVLGQMLPMIDTVADVAKRDG